MRLIPARRIVPQAAKIKGTVSQIKRVETPTKGLSLIGKASEGDAQTATILTNWVVKEDRVVVRPGSKLFTDLFPTGTRHPIAAMMPFLAAPEHMLAASNNSIYRLSTGSPTLVKAGFTSDDWHWSMFANLAQQKYLVMVNGADGVWSYDGGTTPDPAPVAVTGITAANPAVVTVGSGDIAKFSDGMTVVITGASGMWAAANGPHVIGSVGATPNTFTLIGVNLTGATGAGNTGLMADPPGSLVKEAISPGANMPYCNPDQFMVVLAHLNRLYFADSANLVLYYLPLQQKNGTLAQLPMNAVFRRGGRIRTIASWTIDGGKGMDDKLVVFTTNGEAAIYTGIDPEDESFALLGVYQFDDPMSKHCVANYGGDLWVLTSTGLAPMTTLMRAETEKLNKAEKGIISFFTEISKKYHNPVGWGLKFDNMTGRMICNMPLGTTGRYQQMVRFMPDPIWAKWKDFPSRTWAWLGEQLFFGSDDGRILEVNDRYLADNIRPDPADPDLQLSDPITAEVRGPWSNYKTPGIKHFKLVRVYAQSTGLPVRPFIDIGVNYVDRKPSNQPEVMAPAPATMWSVKGSHAGDPGFTPWGSPWGRSKLSVAQWNGVSRMGNVGAPHIMIAIKGATYELSGFDVVFEAGIIV